jgi:hypothetical protein
MSANSGRKTLRPEPQGTVDKLAYCSGCAPNLQTEAGAAFVRDYRIFAARV